MEPGSSRHMPRQQHPRKPIQYVTVGGILALGFCSVGLHWITSHTAASAELAKMKPSDGNRLSAQDNAIAQTVSRSQVNSGTAFFVSHDGKTLTSAHVVRDCQEITIWVNNASPRTGTIIGIDPALDIALLASAGPVDDIARINPTAAASAGDPVTTIGFGVRQHEPRWPEITTGTVFGRATLPSGGRALVVSANLKQGNSGGPVVDNTGSVVGLVIGRYTDRPQLTVAVPAPDLQKFLGRYGIMTESSGAARGTIPKDASSGIGDVLIHMSALVQCKPHGKGSAR